MDFNKLALEMHESHKGKISVNCKVEVKTHNDLSTAYTPGVAEPCRKIRDDKKEVYRYTAKGNLVAVVSDGTAVLVLVDRNGALAPGEDWMNPVQAEMAQRTNAEQIHGSLAEVIKGRDVFIGVSAPNVVTAEMVSTMANDAIVFAMANPTPEIMPDEAKKGGARVVATGRSDFPNQINNVPVFPGIFRGALDAKATDITEEMKIAAAKAIASIVSAEELSEDYIIPGAFDERVAKVVAKAVADTARAQGIVKE